MRHIASLLLLLVVLASCGHRQQADLILHHGRVYTIDSSFTIADAFAVRDGRILAVGTTAQIMAAYTAPTMVDAQGRSVFPGFIDAHTHFLGYGRGLFEVDLFDCKDWEEVVHKVKEFEVAHPNEPWIRGRGWDQNKWPSHKFPDNAPLNVLFPSRPVLLQRVDGHAAIANAKALEMAGIHAGQTLTGGEIETVSGNLTGLLIDNAVELVTRIIPAPTRANYEKWLTAAQNNCFAQGLTTVTDCGLRLHDVFEIDTLQQRGKLHMRLYVMLSDALTLPSSPGNNSPDTVSNAAGFLRYISHGPYKTDLLYVKGVKAYADGALGSRGACLLSPYIDKPGWSGFLLSNRSHFDSLAQLLINTDWQLCTHAIGDSGNRMVLQVYNQYLKGHNDKRWRIEHAQIVNPADFPLFGAASVIPSVQPTHATSDMPWAADRIGTERLKGGYAYAQLLQQNGWLPLGTDFPVEDISPFKTFYAAVVRKDAKGNPPNGFQPENALTRRQAIKGMTIWAARADCLEKEVGSIEPGKKADFVILDQDLLQVPDARILSVNVVSTWLGGKKVH